MRVETKTRTLYKFGELSEDAQETALQRARDWNVDHEWWDFIFDDAKECARLIGIDIDNIYFSGFWSQGDGACFTGAYAYRKGALAAIKQHAPQDETLHGIASALQELQRRAFYQLEASISRGPGSNFYSHDGTMSVNVYRDGNRFDVTDEQENGITEAMRDFACWIYRQLEREYDYLTSDEQVRESLEANECEFDEDGNLA